MRWRISIKSAKMKYSIVVEAISWRCWQRVWRKILSSQYAIPFSPLYYWYWLTSIDGYWKWKDAHVSRIVDDISFTRPLFLQKGLGLRALLSMMYLQSNSPNYGRAWSLSSRKGMSLLRVAVGFQAPKPAYAARMVSGANRRLMHTTARCNKAWNPRSSNEAVNRVWQRRPLERAADLGRCIGGRPGRCVDSCRSRRCLEPWICDNVKACAVGFWRR